MTAIPEHLSDVELQVLHYRAAQEIDRREGAVDTYAAPHVWNLVAKILRENFPLLLAERRPVVDIALAFARRFAEDDNFSPTDFLSKCSPNNDLYPLSELWEE